MLKILMMIISDVLRVCLRICTPLLLIQKEQLSVDGERMFTKYWLTASGRLDQ